MFIAGFPAGTLAANCYLVAPAAGGPCVVIDPGEEALNQIVAMVSEHELEVRAAFGTHGHLDHVASLRLVTERFGVPGHVHTADQYMLRDPLAALSPELRTLFAGYPIPDMQPADLRSADGGELQFGELTISVLSTPGHTPGSVVYRLPGDGERPDVLFTGDTLFPGSVGRTDLPGGSTAMLQESLRRLLEMADETVVLSGHGPRTTIGAERRTNPFLAALGASDG